MSNAAGVEVANFVVLDRRYWMVPMAVELAELMSRPLYSPLPYLLYVTCCETNVYVYPYLSATTDSDNSSRDGGEVHVSYGCDDVRWRMSVRVRVKVRDE